MSENDLSDEAWNEWMCSDEVSFQPEYGLNIVPMAKKAWQEARRRAEANPWQLFDLASLKGFKTLFPSRKDLSPYWEDQLALLDAELARRKGQQ